MGILDDMLTAGIKKEHFAPISLFSYRVGMMIIVSWSFGFLSFVGIEGFARASEVDGKIVAAVKPITQALQTAAAEQASYRVLLIESLSNTKAAEIRALALKRCKASSSSDRGWLNDEIELRQGEYEKLAGHRYDIPACNEL